MENQGDSGPVGIVAAAAAADQAIDARDDRAYHLDQEQHGSRHAELGQMHARDSKRGAACSFVAGPVHRLSIGARSASPTRIKAVMYLITTAITTNKIIAGIVVLLVIVGAGFFWLRSRRTT